MCGQGDGQWAGASRAGFPQYRQRHGAASIAAATTQPPNQTNGIGAADVRPMNGHSSGSNRLNDALHGHAGGGGKFFDGVRLGADGLHKSGVRLFGSSTKVLH